MALNKVSKSSKWFSNKNLRLPLGRGRTKSTSSSTPSSPPSSTSTESCMKRASREDELRGVFCHFDKDGDGKISSLELRDYFGLIGETISQEDAQLVVSDLDTNGDGLLDFDDFLKLMTTKKTDGDDNEELRKAFEMFELEKGAGCITPKGLQRMLQRLGDAKSQEECATMIRFYDTDGNGVLDFQEFHRMMA